MWIFTTDGFFSVVQDRYCTKAEVMVRSRVKEDLERFMQRMLLDKVGAEIIELEFADYRYRVKVAKTTWAIYLKEMGDSIDYETVKDNISPDVNHDRADTYYKVWMTTKLWQRLEHYAFTEEPI